MSERNRAEGWQHAKLTGHENEALVKELFSAEGTFRSEFLKRLGKENLNLVSYEIGGLHETSVDSVFGDKTKSKTDLKIVLEDGSEFNISIKKSLSGQVFLIGVDRFIKGFEKQYGVAISDNVKKAIELFWGTHEDTTDIVKNFGVNKAYENRKHRSVANTLKVYNEELYVQLLLWFKDNITEIFDFCFCRGLAKKQEDWANVVWYINKLGENDVDEVFLTSELKEKMLTSINETIFYGNKGGGTTIQLPFGFVQWHNPGNKGKFGSIQFHHGYKKLINL